MPSYSKDLELSKDSFRASGSGSTLGLLILEFNLISQEMESSSNSLVLVKKPSTFAHLVIQPYHFRLQNHSSFFFRESLHPIQKVYLAQWI